MRKNFDHRVVKHKEGNYTTPTGDSTNGVENFWSHFKRMIIGVYHQVSAEHMNRYLAAQSFRYNNRALAEWERFTLAADKTQGKRITYNQLTRKV